MAISLEEIQMLCLQGESSFLDYKRDQYCFVGKKEEEKAELLKDILAMANSVRTQTAYILIGVDQQTGEPGKIVGIPKDQYIDDASIQQFVNQKTNRQITFSCYIVPLNSDLIVEVIEIPVQKKPPYFSTKRIGSIKANVVLWRVGSSTQEANPDEIAIIARGGAFPQEQRDIEISLCVPQNPIGDLNFRGRELTLVGSPPQYSDEWPLPNYMNNLRTVPFEEKFAYIQSVLRTVRVDIGLENKSGLSAEQLEVETSVTQCSYNCIQEIESFPVRPTWDKLPSFSNFRGRSLLQQTLHPGQYMSAFDSLYFEVEHNGDFTLDVSILGKDMLPIKKEFHIDVKQEKYTIDAKKVDDIFAFLQNEEKYEEFCSKF